MMLAVECIDIPPTGGLEKGKVYIAIDEYTWQGQEYFKIKIDEKVFLFLKSWFEVLDN